MKKRLVKKWIKRYITPLIQGLPTTDHYANKVTIGRDKWGFEEYIVCQRQHAIINGHITAEGYIPFDSSGIRRDIIRTSETINHIKSMHKHVFLRISPQVQHGRIYTRLITE